MLVLELSRVEQLQHEFVLNSGAARPAVAPSKARSNSAWLLQGIRYLRPERGRELEKRNTDKMHEASHRSQRQDTAWSDHAPNLGLVLACPCESTSAVAATSRRGSLAGFVARQYR